MVDRYDWKSHPRWGEWFEVHLARCMLLNQRAFLARAYLYETVEEGPDIDPDTMKPVNESFGVRYASGVGVDAFVKWFKEHGYE